MDAQNYSDDWENKLWRMTRDRKGREDGRGDGRPDSVYQDRDGVDETSYKLRRLTPVVGTTLTGRRTGSCGARNHGDGALGALAWGLRRGRARSG